MGWCYSILIIAASAFNASSPHALQSVYGLHHFPASSLLADWEKQGKKVQVLGPLPRWLQPASALASHCRLQGGESDEERSHLLLHPHDWKCPWGMLPGWRQILKAYAQATSPAHMARAQANEPSLLLFRVHVSRKLESGMGLLNPGPDLGDMVF